MAHSKKVHVIAEYPNREEALDKFQQLVESNQGSAATPKGKYAVRKKPDQL